jgi:crotonobetainyl-CoA:carnitine CoA-transferase CaiB-like acyl-CoA transferase
MKKPKSALEGLKVIDCTQMLAGSWCSMILADLGADVVKIDRPSGDTTRTLHGQFRYYDYINRNKRSLALDIKQADAPAILRRMAESADIFVENWRPGYLDRIGLGYEDLKAINPRLIYCSISGFGHDGPYRELGGLDLVTQAISGVMSYNGAAGGEPQPTGMSISDLTAGTFGAIAVLSALNHRHASGVGQHVETTLLESILSFTVIQSGLYFSNGEVAQPVGARNRLATPYEPLATKDGMLVVGAGTQSLFERTCDLLGLPELKTDPRFSTMTARLAQRETFRAYLEAVLVTETSAHWLTLFARAGIPAGPINSIAQALADPQVAARGMVVDVDGKNFLRTPVTLHGSPVEIRRGAPDLGAQGEEVLAEYGFDQKEIAGFVASNTVLKP